MFGWGARRQAQEDLRSLATEVRFALPRETERLRLRALMPDDADALAATIDPAVIAANGWRGNSAEQAARAARGGQLAAVRPSVLVTAKESGDVVGVVTVSTVDPERRCCELGWWMGPTARGQGYGTEAVTAVVYLLHGLGVRRVLVGTASDNEAVTRVLDKIGAHRIEDRPHRLPNGRVIASVWFAHDALTAGGAEV